MNATDTPPPSRRGLLLFAHGARDARWADPFHAVARAVQDREPGLEVALAFLEFMSPDLEAAARRLVEVGCGQVHVVPLFLGAGGHVRRDLPLLVDRLQAEHPQVQWRLHPAVGELPRVIAALAATALELAREAPEPSPVGQSVPPSAPAAP